MPEKVPVFNFLPTCIGSVPFKDVNATCRTILDNLPLMPFWPQFVNRSYMEDMIVQFSEGLPLLEIREQERTIVASMDGDGMESELVTFYDHFLGEDVDYFAMSREFAPGLYELVDLMGQLPEKWGAYIKGQVVGPVTFVASVTDQEGRPLFHNPDLCEAMVKGLSIKALWQIRKLDIFNRRPVIFLDEPYLSSVGSAFSPVQRGDVIMMLEEVIRYLKERSHALIGVHCCGNTDWSMVIESGPDIINFDAFDYMAHFFLYRKEIVRFLEEGGILAWGMVPTANLSGDQSVDTLLSALEKGLMKICEWGIKREMLFERSILTPACGMGSMTPGLAQKGMELLYGLSREIVSNAGA